MQEIKDLTQFSRIELSERLRYLETKNAYDLSWLELLLVRVYHIGRMRED